MKDNIDHLPEEKQAALRGIIPVILEMGEDVEMIILFGSHARGTYRDEEDLDPDRKSGGPSDFDILVVCKHKSSAARLALWGSIEEKCNGIDPTMPFRLIAHDIGYLKKRLKEIHYFFSDIVKEGCLLYDSGNYQISVGKELNSEDRLRVAKEHFDHWYEKSQSFHRNYQFNLENDDLIMASFMLHQSAEASYKALLLVYTNYTPHDHYLISMGRHTQEVLPNMEEIFPCFNEQDRQSFENFDYAYIGARYDREFKISKNDLNYFAGRVERLIELTQKLCDEKLMA